MPTARDRILDATETCLRRDGIRRTTVAGVAAEAGLSRTYVHRLFSDKSTLVSAALIRRDGEFWEAAHTRISAAEDVAGMVAEAVLLSRASPLGPLALTLAESEPEAYAQVMGTYVQDIVPGLFDFWVSELGEARRRGLVRDGLDLDDAAEWVIRVLVSLVGIPGVRVDADDRDALHAYLATFLSPALAPASMTA